MIAGGCGDAGFTQTLGYVTYHILHGVPSGVAERVKLHSQIDHKLIAVTAVRSRFGSVHIEPSISR